MTSIKYYYRYILKKEVKLSSQYVMKIFKRETIQKILFQDSIYELQYTFLWYMQYRNRSELLS